MTYRQVQCKHRVMLFIKQTSPHLHPSTSRQPLQSYQRLCAAVIDCVAVRITVTVVHNATEIEVDSRSLTDHRVTNVTRRFIIHIMPIGKVWIYIGYFFVYFLFVCTDTDFSAEDKASGVKFCTVVRGRPGQGISYLGALCSPDAQNRTNWSLA